MATVALLFILRLFTPTFGQTVRPVETTLSPDAGPVIDLGYAKYLGYTNTTAGINYWRGIQYAASPTGDLRWRKPVPIDRARSLKADTIYNATIPAPACPQIVPEPWYGDPEFTFDPPYGQSEDCLILDILQPINRVSTSIPVIMQIHGGGYDGGEAQFYAGDAMTNRSNGNIIYVSIQYRLGFLGFLGGNEVASRGIRNAGLYDQREALDWVQRHIRAFGGDPARVTIWGGSAGGGSVSAQLIANGGKGNPPFSAAIAEYPWWQPFLNDTQQETTYRQALSLSNCDSITCLRSLSEQDVMTLGQAVLNASYPGPSAVFGVYFFGPVVDGELIQDLPGLEFGRGNFHDVPLIVTRNAYEGYYFTNQDLKVSSAATTSEAARELELLFPFAGPAFFSRLYQLYPREEFNSTFFQRQTWFGDFIINCPTYTMASNAIDRNSNRSAVWKMVFAAGFQFHGATRFFLAANTTDTDLPYTNNPRLVDAMMSYWISFAVTGDPNGGVTTKAPERWESYVSGGNDSIGVGDLVGFRTLRVSDDDFEMVTDPDASARCDFFGSHRFQVQN